MVWSGSEKEITRWCKTNKVNDEITDKEIEEIWIGEPPDDSEAMRLNAKYVFETSKRVCDFINARQDFFHSTTLVEYRVVMQKAMKVIREAHNNERKRRQTAKSRRSEETEERSEQRRLSPL